MYQCKTQGTTGAFSINPWTPQFYHVDHGLFLTARSSWCGALIRGQHSAPWLQLGVFLVKIKSINYHLFMTFNFSFSCDREWKPPAFPTRGRRWRWPLTTPRAEAGDPQRSSPGRQTRARLAKHQPSSCAQQAWGSQAAGHILLQRGLQQDRDQLPVLKRSSSVSQLPGIKIIMT